MRNAARHRAYGLGDTRGASGASPKSLLRFRRNPNGDFERNQGKSSRKFGIRVTAGNNSHQNCHWSQRMT